MPPAAEEDIAPEAEVAEAEAEIQQAAPATRGLRSWFSRRARSVGTTLTAYEPPGAEPPVTPAANPAEDDADAVRAAEALAEMRADEELPEVSVEEAESDNAERLANLSADMILGRTRVLMLAALDNPHEAELLAERLVGDVLHRGLSIACVDAGSGRPSTEPGITDLAAEEASFGDVVHKRGDEGLAEIPWGHLPTLDRRSGRPLTLVEALSDIYEVVVVMTGRIGIASTLPLFAGVPSRLVLVAGGTPDAAQLEAARADAAALGYANVEVIAAPAWQAEVA
jgi:hypothetical protein